MSPDDMASDINADAPAESMDLFRLNRIKTNAYLYYITKRLTTHLFITTNYDISTEKITATTVIDEINKI